MYHEGVQHHPLDSDRNRDLIRIHRIRQLLKTCYDDNWEGLDTCVAIINRHSDRFNDDQQKFRVLTKELPNLNRVPHRFQRGDVR